MCDKHDLLFYWEESATCTRYVFASTIATEIFRNSNRWGGDATCRSRLIILVSDAWQYIATLYELWSILSSMDPSVSIPAVYCNIHFLPTHFHPRSFASIVETLKPERGDALNFSTFFDSFCWNCGDPRAFAASLGKELIERKSGTDLSLRVLYAREILHYAQAQLQQINQSMEMKCTTIAPTCTCVWWNRSAPSLL